MKEIISNSDLECVLKSQRWNSPICQPHVGVDDWAKDHVIYDPNIYDTVAIVDKLLWCHDSCIGPYGFTPFEKHTLCWVFQEVKDSVFFKMVWV